MLYKLIIISKSSIKYLFNSTPRISLVRPLPRSVSSGSWGYHRFSTHLRPCEDVLEEGTTEKQEPFHFNQCYNKSRYVTKKNSLWY